MLYVSIQKPLPREKKLCKSAPLVSVLWHEAAIVSIFVPLRVSAQLLNQKCQQFLRHVLDFGVPLRFVWRSTHAETNA